MKIYKLDVMNYPDIAKKYDILGVPVLLYFKDGKIVDRKMGVQDPSKLKDLEIKNF